MPDSVKGGLLGAHSLHPPPQHHHRVGIIPARETEQWVKCTIP